MYIYFFINPFTAELHKVDSPMLKIGPLHFFDQQDIGYYLMSKWQAVSPVSVLFAKAFTCPLAAKEVRYQQCHFISARACVCKLTITFIKMVTICTYTHVLN